VFVVQIVYGVTFAWPVWAFIAVIAIVSPLPLLAWRAGRWQASLATAAFSVAAQFVVVMTLILPPVAETCSARQLAEYFNRQGWVPSRLLVVEGRIGSLVFYLDRPLRDGLQPDQFQVVLAKELPEPRPGDVIAVNEWKVFKLRRYFDADGTPYESVGSYRLYRGKSSHAPDDRSSAAGAGG
jgi:hypothetical protein